MSLCSCLLLILVLFPHEETPALSSTRRNHVPIFCTARAPFEPDAERLKFLLKVLHPVPILSPGVGLTQTISPNITLLGRRSSRMRTTKPANNLLRLCAVVSTRPGPVLRSALAWDRVWSYRFCCRQRRHQRSIWWWTFRSLLQSAFLGPHVTHPYSSVSRSSLFSIRTFQA